MTHASNSKRKVTSIREKNPSEPKIRKRVISDTTRKIGRESARRFRLKHKEEEMKCMMKIEDIGIQNVFLTSEVKILKYKRDMLIQEIKKRKSVDKS